MVYNLNMEQPAIVMNDKTIWREAAAYLIALRTTPFDVKEVRFRAVATDWESKPDSEIMEKLKGWPGCGAADRLVEGDARQWSIRPMQLAELHLRGGEVLITR